MINIFRIYPLWTCVLWTAILGLAAGTEVLGLLRVWGAIPLTWMIRDSLPMWARWMIIGYLMYHFGILTNSGQPLK